MPELAEVEFFRKRWDSGLGRPILALKLHARKRLFRKVPVPELLRLLPGSRLSRSEARGKQLLFRFSKDLWLGIHLGMSGQLLAERPDFNPGKHDHLVLYQRDRALVFRDPRLFGLLRFAQSGSLPEWWAKLPLSASSKGFNRAAVRSFLQRHQRLPIKAALLLQAGFPGIGNWMADEILWRARMHPLMRCATLDAIAVTVLWKQVRWVSRAALRHIGHDFSDPPPGWLFHQRWHSAGRCPIHAVPLTRRTVAGRTTVWCPICQIQQSRRSRKGPVFPGKG